MKTLLLFTFLFVSSLLSYSQDSGTDPNPDPNFICGSPFCFKNTTSCFMKVCISISEFDDSCPGATPSSFYQCIYLSAGETDCIELGLSPEGCKLCPTKYMFGICGDDREPCIAFIQSERGGQKPIHCNGAPDKMISCYWDPATGTFIITE